MSTPISFNTDCTSRTDECPICTLGFNDRPKRAIATHNGLHPIHVDCLIRNIISCHNKNWPIRCHMCRRNITHVNGTTVEKIAQGNYYQDQNEKRNKIFKVAFAAASILIGGLAGYGITNAAISASFIPQAFSTGTMVLGACFGATSAALNFAYDFNSFENKVNLLSTAGISTALSDAVAYSTANLAYNSARNAASSAHYSARNAASSAHYSAINAASSVHSSAIDAAQSSFKSASDAAESIRSSALDAAESIRSSALDAASSDYDATYSLNTIARLSSVFVANFIVGGAIGLGLRKVYNNFIRA